MPERHPAVAGDRRADVLLIALENIMPIRFRWGLLSVVVLGFLAAFTLTTLNPVFIAPALAQSPEPEAPPASQPGVEPEAKPEANPKQLNLSLATMCEGVDGLSPVNRAAVFSVSMGKVNCFTVFNPVPEPTQIYHRWYHRGELSTQIRLRVNPPRWATYSLIQLRETDKGPWRVEITDSNNKILGVLRFSITD